MFDWLFHTFAAPALLDGIGADDTAEYLGPDDVSCGLYRVIADPEEAIDEQGPEKRVVRQVRMFHFLRDANLPFWDLVAKPETGGSVIYQGQTYFVDSIANRSESFAVLKTIRRPVVEQARPGYRRAGR
jgi:hypothetical protein